MNRIRLYLILMVCSFGISLTAANNAQITQTQRCQAFKTFKLQPECVKDFCNCCCHYETPVDVCCNPNGEGTMITMNNGAQVCFNNYGQWHSIELMNGENVDYLVMKFLLPHKAIKALKKDNQCDKVKKISFDFDKGFEVALLDGNKVNFNKTGVRK